MPSEYVCAEVPVYVRPGPITAQARGSLISWRSTGWRRVPSAVSRDSGPAWMAEDPQSACHGFTWFGVVTLKGTHLLRIVVGNAIILGCHKPLSLRFLEAASLPPDALGLQGIWPSCCNSSRLRDGHRRVPSGRYPGPCGKVTPPSRCAPGHWPACSKCDSKASREDEMVASPSRCTALSRSRNFVALSTDQTIINELRGVRYLRLRTFLWLWCPEHLFDPGFQQLAARLMEIAEFENVLRQRPKKVHLDVVRPALG